MLSPHNSIPLGSPFWCHMSDVETVGPLEDTLRQWRRVLLIACLILAALATVTRSQTKDVGVPPPFNPPVFVERHVATNPILLPDEPVATSAVTMKKLAPRRSLDVDLPPLDAAPQLRVAQPRHINQHACMWPIVHVETNELCGNASHPVNKRSLGDLARFWDNDVHCRMIRSRIAPQTERRWGWCAEWSTSSWDHGLTLTPDLLRSLLPSSSRHHREGAAPLCSQRYLARHSVNATFPFVMIGNDTKTKKLSSSMCSFERLTSLQLVALLYQLSHNGRRLILVSGDSVMRQFFTLLVGKIRDSSEPVIEGWNLWGDGFYAVKAKGDQFALQNNDGSTYGAIPDCILDDDDNPCLFMINFLWTPHEREFSAGALRKAKVARSKKVVAHSCDAETSKSVTLQRTKLDLPWSHVPGLHVHAFHYWMVQQDNPDESVTQWTRNFFDVILDLRDAAVASEGCRRQYHFFQMTTPTSPRDSVRQHLIDVRQSATDAILALKGHNVALAATLREGRVSTQDASDIKTAVKQGLVSLHSIDYAGVAAALKEEVRLDGVHFVCSYGRVPHVGTVSNFQTSGRLNCFDPVGSSTWDLIANLLRTFSYDNSTSVDTP